MAVQPGNQNVGFLMPQLISILHTLLYCCAQQTGFEMDEHLDADNIIRQTNKFQPLEDPKNSTSRKLTINISRVTGNLFIYLEAKRICVAERKRKERKAIAKGSSSDSVQSEFTCSICNRQFRAKIDLNSHQ